YGPAGAPADPAEMLPLTEGASVPSSSVLVVRFTEPMSAASMSPRLIVLKNGAKRVGLLNGAPTLSADGLSVILEPEEPLPQGSKLTLTIRGGARGVTSERGVTMGDPRATVAFTAATETIPGLGAAD